MFLEHEGVWMEWQPTTSFYRDCSNNTGTFCLTATYGYCCNSGKTPNGQHGRANNGGSTPGSGGGTTQFSQIPGQVHSIMSALMKSHQLTSQ